MKSSNFKHLSIFIIHLSYYYSNRAYKSWNSSIRPRVLHKKVERSSTVRDREREREFYLV